MISCPGQCMALHADSLLSQRSARALLSSRGGAAAGSGAAGAADCECSLIGYTGYNNTYVYQGTVAIVVSQISCDLHGPAARGSAEPAECLRNFRLKLCCPRHIANVDNLSFCKVLKKVMAARRRWQRPAGVYTIHPTTTRPLHLAAEAVAADGPTPLGGPDGRLWRQPRQSRPPGPTTGGTRGGRVGWARWGGGWEG